MAKTKEQKQEAVKKLVNGIGDAKGVVFANFQGLTVEQAQNLRSACKKEDISVLAAKKTIVARACQQAGLEDVDCKGFDGGIATFMSMDDEVAAARVVNDFAKGHNVVRIFGGVLEGNYIDQTSVQNLAKLPSKQHLLGQVVGVINAPISGFVNALAGNMRNLLGVLNNLKEAKS
ncbi:MAG: 50S ribosomal protein L10 [bacterium]